MHPLNVPSFLLNTQIRRQFVPPLLSLVLVEIAVVYLQSTLTLFITLFDLYFFFFACLNTITMEFLKKTSFWRLDL